MTSRIAAAFASAALAISACAVTNILPTGGPVAEPSEAGARIDGGGASLGLPCAVDRILAKNCRQCHGKPAAFGAPMQLVTLDDTRATSRVDGARKVYERIGARVHDDNAPMPQPPNARLGAADLATLDEWIAGGARSGAACGDGDAGLAPDSAASTLSCTPDRHVAPASAFAIPTDTDELYVCYGFEAHGTAKRHIIAMAPVLDAQSVVHHISLLQSDTPVDPTPTPCPLGGSASWRSVYGWAPGIKSFELPQEAGFPEDATTHYVVQVHYANPARIPGLTDASGFALCTTDRLRPNDADIMAFGTQKFTIPARGALDTTCSVPVPVNGATTHLFAAFPHMHRLGRSISTVALPSGGGSPVDLGAQPHWDFGNQAWIPIDDVLRPGDVVETRCAWQNTKDQAVSFGEKTENEMCYSFVMYYPKITDPAWHWYLPAAYSTCR